MHTDTGMERLTVTVAEQLTAEHSLENWTHIQTLRQHCFDLATRSAVTYAGNQCALNWHISVFAATHNFIGSATTKWSIQQLIARFFCIIESFRFSCVFFSLFYCGSLLSTTKVFHLSAHTWNCMQIIYVSKVRSRSCDGGPNTARKHSSIRKYRFQLVARRCQGATYCRWPRAGTGTYQECIRYRNQFMNNMLCAMFWRKRPNQSISCQLCEKCNRLSAT